MIKLQHILCKVKDHIYISLLIQTKTVKKWPPFNTFWTKKVAETSVIMAAFTAVKLEQRVCSKCIYKSSWNNYYSLSFIAVGVCVADIRG